MYQLTNVPTKASGTPITVEVDGEIITIVAKGKDYSSTMTSFHVGDHMLSKPEDLRRMIGGFVATAIELARDRGYDQCQADIRHALGMK